jgi:hypothetical protein
MNHRCDTLAMKAAAAPTLYDHAYERINPAKIATVDESKGNNGKTQIFFEGVLFSPAEPALLKRSREISKRITKRRVRNTKPAFWLSNPK